MIYTNGTILTLDEKQQVEAILVQDGRITCSGSLAECQSAADDEIYDLQGKVLMPAFIDAHSHLCALSSTMGLVDLSSARSHQDIVDMLARYIETNEIPKGEWVSGFGYDHNFLKEKEHPHADLLDQFDNPILIAHVSGHMGVCNTLGLKALGIDENTADPEGGKIGRDDKGCTGYLEETAFTTTTSKMPPKNMEQRVKELKMAQQLYLSYGITTVQDGYTTAADFELLKEASDHGELKCDVVSYVDLKSNAFLIDEYPAYVKQYRNKLKIGGYKIFLDGSPQGRTAWMKQPYVGEEEYRGYPIYTDEQVEAFMKKAVEDKMQILTHCNGDAAAQQLIDAYEKALAGNDVDLRAVMVHAQLVDEEELKKMGCLKMIASFFVAHTYYWGDIHIQNFGYDKAKDISPVKWAIEHGVDYTFHQDTPVIPPNMFETVWCAVKRMTKNGVALDQAQCVDVKEALKGVCQNAAYQYFEEKTKGSLSVGKLADMIVVSDNPLTCDVDSIKDIQVLKTFKEGNIVYQR